jgi:hypothetical protein
VVILSTEGPEPLATTFGLNTAVEAAGNPVRLVAAGTSLEPGTTFDPVKLRLTFCVKPFSGATFRA